MRTEMATTATGNRPTILKNPRALLALLLILAGMARVVYFVQINDTPLVHQHVYELSDMNHFDQWARNIAAGDWLTRQNIHPFHDWHRMIAEEYLTGGRPDRAAPDEGELRALW